MAERRSEGFYYLCEKPCSVKHNLTCKKLQVLVLELEEKHRRGLNCVFIEFKKFSHILSDCRYLDYIYLDSGLVYQKVRL